MTQTPAAPAPDACIHALSDIVGAAHVRTGPDTAKWSRDWTGWGGQCGWGRGRTVRGLWNGCECGRIERMMETLVFLSL